MCAILPPDWGPRKMIVSVTKSLAHLTLWTLICLIGFSGWLGSCWSARYSCELWIVMLNKYFHHHTITYSVPQQHHNHHLHGTTTSREKIFVSENGLQNRPDKSATIKSVKGLVSPFVMFRHSATQFKLSNKDKMNG